jgi:5'-phosphate synthase pdxT subunit
MILLANRVAGSANAPALGGMDVLVRRNAFGRQAESFETDLEIAGVADGERGGPMRAVFIRAPLIEQVGDQVQVLARLPKLNAVALDLATVDGSEIYPPDGELEVPDGGTQLQALDSEVPNIVVAARQGNLLATAFHPEVTDDLRLHEYFLQMC